MPSSNSKLNKLISKLKTYFTMKNKNLTSFALHLDQQYGKKGSKTRDDYEQGFEAFKLGVILQEMRKKKGKIGRAHVWTPVTL